MRPPTALSTVTYEEEIKIRVSLDHPRAVSYFDCRSVGGRLVRIQERAGRTSAAGGNKRLRDRNDTRHAGELAIRVSATDLASSGAELPVVRRLAAIQGRGRSQRG